MNYKHNPPKPVDLKHGDGTEYTLSRIEDALLTYKSMTVPRNKVAVNSVPSNLTKHFP